MVIEGRERLHLVKFVVDSHRQLVRAGVRGTILPALEGEYRRPTWYTDIDLVRFGAGSQNTGSPVELQVVHPNKGHYSRTKPWHEDVYTSSGLLLSKGLRSVPLRRGQSEVLFSIADTSRERGYGASDVVSVLTDREVCFPFR